MAFVVTIILFVPAFLLVIIALVRQPDKTAFVLTVLAFGAALLFIWLVFPWHLASMWLRFALPFIFLAAVFVGARRIQPPAKPRKTWVKYLNAAINLLVFIFMAGLCWQALIGYQVEAEAVSLDLPLRDTRFVVLNGGNSPFLNRHFHAGQQRHALDILALNEWGSRSVPFADRTDLNNYAIYGQTVYSPCDGRVLQTVDGLPDLSPGKTDRENLAGNHILIECAGVELLIAHLQPGSVRVSASQEIESGDPLGRVGNSGNTSEPHLHIHAERGGEPGVIMDGEAVPMRFDGRYLVRGDLFGPEGESR